MSISRTCLLAVLLACCCVQPPQPWRLVVAVDSPELGQTSVRLDGGLIACANGCQLDLTPQSAVVVATPSVDAQVRFTGDCTASADGTQCVVDGTSTRSVGVSYARADAGGPMATLVVRVKGNGSVASKLFRLPCDAQRSPCTAAVARGTKVSLEATAAPTTHVGWSVDCAGSLCDLSMEQDLDLSVDFLEFFHLHLDGIAFPDGGTILVDGVRKGLPFDELVANGTRRVLKPDAVPGFTAVGFEGVPCSETTWSATCSVEVRADVDGGLRMKRFTQWLWAIGNQLQTADLAPLGDGGALMVATYTSTTVTGTPLRADGGHHALVMEFSGRQQVGAWSASRGDSANWEDAVLMPSDAGYFMAAGLVCRAPGGCEAQWGAVNAGRPSRLGLDLAIVELDQQRWAPTRAAFVSSSDTRGTTAGLKGPVLMHEGAPRVALRLAGSFPELWDAGIVAAAVVEPDFGTQSVRIVTLSARAPALHSGLTEQGLAWLAPAMSTLPVERGCPASDVGIAEYLPDTGCGTFVALGSDVLGHQFRVDGASALLAFQRGRYATGRYGIAKYDAHTLALLWETTFTTSALAGGSAVDHYAVMPWGSDVLTVWGESQFKGTLSPDGVPLACASDPAAVGTGSDTHFAVLDGATGRLKWTDCVPQAAAGATTVFSGRTRVAPLGEGVVVSGTTGTGRVVFGDTTSNASSDAVLYSVTPPRF